MPRVNPILVCLNPRKPPLIFTAKPELGLYPDALDILAKILIEAKSTTQFIVSTHSDILVSEFADETDSGLICGHLGDGTEFPRLESARLQNWLRKNRPSRRTINAS